MRSITIIFLLYNVFLFTAFSQSIQILESNEEHFIVQINFENSYLVKDTISNNKNFNFILSKEIVIRNPGEPWLPEFNFSLGVPKSSIPKITVLESNHNVQSNKFIIPYPLEDPDYNPDFFEKFDDQIYNDNNFFPANIAEIKDDYIFRYLRFISLSLSPFQFNPVTRELVFYKSMKIKVDYNHNNLALDNRIQDAFTEEVAKDQIINFDVAKNWISKPVENDSPLNDISWYDPLKNYYKIYLNKKGVYRITYSDLVSAGVPLPQSIPSSRLGLYSGNSSVPIDVSDGGDGNFEGNDFFQFVGFSAPASEYSSLNIYNKSNIYWFTFENDSAVSRYNTVAGFPSPGTFQRNVDSYKHSALYEKDELYENFGYAINGNRDFWQWGKAIARNQQPISGFEKFFDDFEHIHADSKYVNIKVDMHGLSTNRYCSTHKANIFITDQSIGSVVWDGQNAATFIKRFYVSTDSIKIYPTGNRLNVWVNGDICPPTLNPDDEIRVNRFEFEYSRYLITAGSNFIFTSDPNQTGTNRYWLSRWTASNAKIYIPSKLKLITNPEIPNDQYKSLRFLDTNYTKTEFFLVSSDYFLTVDSIRSDKPSDLKNLSNGADYIIITHPDFRDVADRLKQFRLSDFPDTSVTNPRIVITDVVDIYDQFSAGLLHPNSIKEFVKYTFENWQTPAPSYIVLLGDMSRDYRSNIPGSRKNYIPSMPFFTNQYGQAVSDNNFVAISGEDLAPDLAIGRLSIETVAEGNVLLDKIETYPGDNSKAWKQNVLLFASGLSLEDENTFGFNDASIVLQNNYVASQGYSTSKVFRYPNKPEHVPFQGQGLQIRNKFNEGGVLANYYGHGGGYQWDLVFTNDDIYQLQNGARLPFISSVTCYTAHFDNQNVFGEQFNKVAGKGSIAFFGSAGLTYWGVGKSINQFMFDHIFKRRTTIIGKAILKAKNSVSAIGAFGTQVALLTLLGDPLINLALPQKPDFEIKTSGIKITPSNPLINDSVVVKVNIRNYGTIFPLDSVSVELTATSVDTSYTIGLVKRPSFGEYDSIFFSWVSTISGLFELKVNINHIDVIDEDDLSDNSASAFYVVYSISEPNILNPIDGFTTADKADFHFIDIGEYLEIPLKYFIEIDTSWTFGNPILFSGEIIPSNGSAKWSANSLQQGVYFWRARVFDGENYGRWSNTRNFTIQSEVKDGYYASKNVLKTFETYNINYSDLTNSLILNTELLPPKPRNKRFIEDINFTDSTLVDSLMLTTITTDGTYLYTGTAQYFAYDPTTNPFGLSRIHKFGTGNNGTIKGEYYGYFENFHDQIINQIFYHSDGNIYIATKNPFKLRYVNVATGDTASVSIPDGMLRWEDARPLEGGFYVNSDGQYVYNITIFDSTGDNKYILRTFDPGNNWQRTKPDMILAGKSYTPGFSGFFIANGYLFPAEYYWHNEIRRYKLSDGTFEEEWRSSDPFKSYYSWCYDWVNDNVYSSVFRLFSSYKAKFSKFVGTYTDANGTITSNSVGPAKKWNYVSYNLVNNSLTGISEVELHGYNVNSKSWDTLLTNIPSTFNVSDISTSIYKGLRVFVNLTDSSLGASEPMKFSDLQISYEQLPEVSLTKNNISVSPDSMIQGIETKLDLKVINLGNSFADSLKVSFYLNDADTAFYSPIISVPADSSVQLEYTIKTDKIIFNNDIKVVAQSPNPEYFTFNNKIDRTFYVSRDSIKPKFQITFDGQEILDGDIISVKPTVLVTLEDNSPLPLTPSQFTLVHNNVPLQSTNPDLTYNYQPHPNSKMEVTWTPTLPDGKHVLEVLAKDSSGNFFDSTSRKSIFYVYENPDLLNVYNYPNPFTDNTNFTFELRGTTIPEKFRIKIFTIAGRLIREIEIPSGILQIGYNKYFWDGLDQDGDEIANGLYFYKIISVQEGQTKTITQKLAKIK